MKTLQITISLLCLVTLYSFSDTSADSGIPSRKEVRESLSKMKKDTLYVMNRTCKGTFSNEDINRLFEENYTFSTFRVLEDNEIYKVSKQENLTHFALIGEYHTAQSTTEYPGIYLLDKDSKLCEYPYPGVTRFGGNYSQCIRKDKHAVKLIARFTRSLERAILF
jgi:hypothetical protein